MAQTAGNPSGVGPYFKPATLAKLDGRTREARLMRDTRAALTRHVGGSPSATQRMLIERAATLALHVETLDRKVLEGGVFTGHNSRTYRAWINSLTRTLRELGLNAPASADEPANLAAYIASKRVAA